MLFNELINMTIYFINSSFLQIHKWLGMLVEISYYTK